MVVAWLCVVWLVWCGCCGLDSMVWCGGVVGVVWCGWCGVVWLVRWIFLCCGGCDVFFVARVAGVL